VFDLIIEERTIRAEEFLEGIKMQVFTDARFSKVYTDVSDLQENIENIIVQLRTKSSDYLKAKQQAKFNAGSLFFKDQLSLATLNLNAVLLEYEKLCIVHILPTLKQKILEMPDKLEQGAIKLDPAARIEPTIKEPPPAFRVQPDKKVSIEAGGDARVNAFKEKINRALEWIEIPLKTGKNAGEFLSEHSGSIVSAVSGVLKLLAFL
jgi:hypothetical protein